MRLSNLLSNITLHVSVSIIGLIFKVVLHRDMRFKNAINSFDAAYQFRAGSASRQIIFSNGKIKTKKGLISLPDFEIIFLDIFAIIRQVLKNPNDIIRLLLENKIDKTGNTYYLFKLGYLAGVCRCYFRRPYIKIREFLAGFTKLQNGTQGLNM